MRTIYIYHMYGIPFSYEDKGLTIIVVAKLNHINDLIVVKLSLADLILQHNGHGSKMCL